MKYSKERRRQIYDKTTGFCHICHKKIAFINYGANGRRGAWEIEHSVPRAKSGSDHINNLYPACISCNCSKGKKTNKSVRAKHGVRRAPLSKERRKQAKRANAVGGGIVGAVAGSMFGPVGAVIGGAVGAKLGHETNPDRDDDI